MRPDRVRELVKRDQIQPRLLSRTPSSDLLSLQLRAKVPQCAQQCLETYIQQEYNCPCNGLAALCQRYSSRGYTLGELAYICLNQYCGRATTKESLAEYDICDDIRGAVPATYTLLTIPATRPTKSRTSTSATTKPESRTNKLQTTSKTSDVRSGRSSTGSPGAKGTSNPTAGSLSTTPLSTVTSAATSASPSPHSNKVSTTAAIGITVGVLAVTILIVAAMYFFFCVRRRKSKPEEAEKSSKPANGALPKASSRLTVMPADNGRPIARDTIQCWQQLANPSYNLASNINRAIPEPSRTYGNSRPPSSRVLPSPRLPVKARGVSTATAMTIFEEDGEEDEDVPPVPTWKNLGLPPNPRAKLHSPPIVASPTAASQSAASPTVASPQQEPSKSRSDFLLPPKVRRIPPPLKIPESAPKAPIVQVPIVQAPSPVACPPFLNSKESLSHSERRGSTDSRSRSRDSSGSLLNYYASSEAGVDTSSLVADYPAPIELEIPQRHARPPRTEVHGPAYPKSILKRESGGSDTSFESMDFDDEPTPPLEEDKQLTPVQESLASTPVLQTPPISGIRYPQIPRSANDRSPVEKTSPANFHFSPNTPKPWNGARGDHRVHSPGKRSQQNWPLPSTVTPERQTNVKPSLSGSTLAAKRRGDTAAHDLELNLNKFGTAYTGPYVPDHSKRSAQHDSPLKGYDRNGGRKSSHGSQYPERNSSKRYKPPEAPPMSPLKSPLWEPKLTPQRRGDDLYLQVGIATPMSATFPPERFSVR